MFTLIKALKFILVPGLLFLFLNNQPVFGEGTKQLEPTNPSTTPNRRTRLMFDQQIAAHRTPFATINCAERYRLNVYVSDTSERIYFGFNDGTNTLYYQIKDPNGIVVPGFALGMVPSSSAGFISNWDQAVAGPKIGTTNPTGYNPKILAPAKVGNYYIEFASTIGGGSLSGQDMLYFDVSVAQGTSIINGRLWSKAWQLSDEYSGDDVKSYPARFYVYSDDGIVTALNINEWNGGTYTIYCNQWGVSNTNNWAVDRMSDETWPGSDLPQYKIFLNNPDINIFPTGEFGEICEVKSIAKCDGSVDILARVNKPGSLTLSMDIAPSGPGPEDVALNGSINGSPTCDVWDTISWNGLDGNGNPVQNGTTVQIVIDYLNGLTNLPLWDVEDNATGMIVNIIRPVPMFSSKLPIFWDDSNLPGGSINAVNGCIYPTSGVVTGCHSWTNQDENMINTWWYLSEGNTTLNVVLTHNPDADFSYDNNCSGTVTQFTDITSVPSGYITAWHWDFGLFGDTSNIQNPAYTFPNVAAYNVHLMVTSNNGCKGNKFKMVQIQPSPIANAGNDKSIPYGTNTTLQGSITGGSGNFSYHWEPAALLNNPDILNPVTVNLVETTDFTLTVTDLNNTCHHTDKMTVTIFGGVLGIQLNADPSAICPGNSTNINAQVGGGSGNYTYEWTSEPAGFSSNLEDITVQPYTTTTYTLVANDGFTTVTKTIQIMVYSVPVVNTGSSQTIPNGTTAVLNATVLSGMPPYTYSWIPANLLVSPSSLQTTTHNLYTTTSFTLIVTDSHGCTGSDESTVIISGGPLDLDPRAAEPILCKGTSTVLHPMPAGGSGNYSYSWSTNGTVFSTTSDPVVTPPSSTTYYLTVNDGFNQKLDSVSVTVNPLPALNLIPAGAHIFNTDTILSCVFDTVTLDAYQANSKYLWSNGANTPSISSSTTGMAFDMLTYSVDVTNEMTSCSNSAALTIIFTYGECSYGINEDPEATGLYAIPNPNHGRFRCRYTDHMQAEIMNLEGIIIWQSRIYQHPDAGGYIEFDITDQPAGVYLLKVSNSDFLKYIRVVKL